MIDVYYRGEKKSEFSVPTVHAREWVDYGLARWRGSNEVELFYKRGATHFSHLRADLSVRMPPGETEKAAGCTENGSPHPPSVQRVRRWNPLWGRMKLLLTAEQQRALDRALDFQEV